MTTITKPSFATRYLWNYKFLALCCVCLIVIGGGIFYYYRQAQIGSNIKDETIPSDLNGKPPIDTSKWEDDEEIQILREYLRIPSVHPNIDYTPCVDFLKKQAKSLDLPISVHYPVNDKNPVIVMTWQGSKPELSSILLNSHMDVVPVFEEFWKYPPFAAEMDEYGNIFARGVQDTKSIGMQHLAAIRWFKRNGINQMNRTIHITFVPDEELGGYLGMYGFVETKKFKEMNVGFMLDEGGSWGTGTNILGASYAERTVWKADLIFHGHEGQGSKLLNNTPGEKLSYVVDKFMEMRRVESWKLNVLQLPYGKVTSINLTILKGGVDPSVIPPEMRAVFDLRFSIDADLDEFEKQVEKWCEEAGGNITITYPQKEPKALATPIDETNPFWIPFVNAVERLNVTIFPNVVAAATDARFLRRMNIPAIGFDPYVNTPMLAHAHNEYLNADVYLFGIELFKNIITNVANVL